MNEADRAFNPTFDQRQAFLNQLTQGGIYGIEKSMVAQLSSARVGQGSDAAAVLRNGTLSKFNFRPVSCAGLGIAAGLIGILSPPPIDLIFAVGAVTWDLLAYAGLC